MRILAVDDDEISRDLLEYALQRAGHSVSIASRGDEAWELMQTGDYHMLISDWNMPGLTGPELCQQVRAHDFEHYVYVILLTGRESREEAIEGLSAGADAFVSKPISAAELLVRVQTGERLLSLETREVAIFAMAKLAESRDQETGEHLERVQRYSRALAHEMARLPRFHDQIDAEFIRLLYLTSPLHDIGKVGIPDAVLLKPGKLTPEEFEIMKQHAQLGADTLDAALQKFPQARFLEIARDIAATHHERWDGRGYPRGLNGETIPLSGRIVAVADVYDALTSRRVYKDAFSHERARQMIVEGSGTQFDPDIVECFLRREAEFLEIAARFQSERNGECPPSVVAPVTVANGTVPTTLNQTTPSSAAATTTTCVGATTSTREGTPDLTDAILAAAKNGTLPEALQLAGAPAGGAV